MTVTLDIDPEVLDARVPTLLLQPLVENAIRHGVAPRPDAGRIEVRAFRTDGRLTLLVRDDGPGLPDPPPREGVGLANTRARLDRLYGAEHGLTLVNESGGGLAAVVSIPWIRAEDGDGLTPEPRL
jgi:LytS/YehU family sensor histidine kinase